MARQPFAMNEGVSRAVRHLASVSRYIARIIGCAPKTLANACR